MEGSEDRRIYEPVSLKEWLITYVILLIPIVNIVMMFVWAFGSKVNISKKNFFRAQLILLAVLIVIYIIIFAVFGATLMQLDMI